MSLFSPKLVFVIVFTFIIYLISYSILVDLEDGLPDAMVEMIDMEFDFPPRVHCLSRWLVNRYNFTI